MDNNPEQLRIKKSSRPWLRWVLIGLVGVVTALVIAAASTYAWYNDQLQSPNPSSNESVRITIKEGSTVAQIAQNLEENDVIKDANVFQFYKRLNGGQALQAGVYKIDKSANVPAIVAKLESGKVDEFQLTFKPGESILDVQTTLKNAGYEQTAIDQALNKRYDYPMMSGERVADVEGFLLPDTYNFGTDFTAENVINRPLQHMQAYIDDNSLEEAFKKQGLTLYEGITLASIIQKEVNGQSDMRHVSQVFHSRLKKDMPLQSDPTFVYPAKKDDLVASPELDSAYNTYKIKGLPPGPIAMAGKEALYAAAHPSTDTDDLFFVAGDDGTTYFSKTNEEHEALTREHCQQSCRLDIF